MPSRAQITLPPDMHRRAKRRAADLGISFSEYVRRALQKELGEPGQAGNISEIFGMFDSGGSDIAKYKDEYIGEAVYQEHLRDIGERE